MIGCLVTVVSWYLALRALYAVYRIVEELYIIKELNLIERYGKGSWAFITGSTDGIGLGFAQELARRGFNIILAARDRAKMDDKEKLIKQANGNVQILKVVVDFKNSAQDPSFFDQIFKQIEHLDISVIVNNVGVGTNNTPVLDMNMQTALDMIIINCIPQTVFDWYFIPRLAARSTHSAIIDVSSVASTISLPGKEIYSATKYYNKSINNSFEMMSALKKHKIDYLTLKPGFVTTPLTGNRPEDAITCNTTECVNGALKALGHKRETFGATKHVLFGSVIEGITFLFPIPFLLKYRDTLYKIVGYKAFENAQVAK